MKTIELPPYAPTLIESTRAIGYSLEAAVADIIDNSIAAGAKNVDINFFQFMELFICRSWSSNQWLLNESNDLVCYCYRNIMDVRFWS